MGGPVPMWLVNSIIGSTPVNREDGIVEVVRFVPAWATVDEQVQNAPAPFAGLGSLLEERRSGLLHRGSPLVTDCRPARLQTSE